MKIKVGGFEFVDSETGAKVYYRNQHIGDIVTMYEQSGRHCFRLGCDKRKKPRTYRGRVKAAEALKVIHALKQKAKKSRWPTETLIVQAWDEKPHTVGN